MKAKVNKSSTEKASESTSVRINSDAIKHAEDILKFVNKKDFGRNMKLSDLIHFSMELVDHKHIQLLQEKSLTGEDRKERLRQKYIEKNGPISKREFTDFQTTAAYIDFLSAQFPPEEVELVL